VRQTIEKRLDAVGYGSQVSAAQRAAQTDDKPSLPPAIMLRQLAFVMRGSRALYAAAELNLADILAAEPVTERCRKGRRRDGRPIPTSSRRVDWTRRS
jgi:hypothetical protein